ncbi:X2-like carbohydrate binding domain-containing protein [Butyrivibrio sp. CB08]|uniref:X2-like carbohydrate binding domain-containing protein n=1 Tax=Butyrivibrio sp. CB08 TaxID=2364879 RepID=UPI00131480ED|nr:X2-like carbohydrate binding domain-containing protein [Butyrivibrio sp. CB08]
MNRKRLLSSILATALSVNMIIASGFTAYACETEEVTSTESSSETVETTESSSETATETSESTDSSAETAVAAENNTETVTAAESTVETAASEAPTQVNPEYLGGDVMWVVNEGYTDAEKYGTEDYDSQLCWAATAANMIWDGNYGSGTINPMTGEYFTSVDEVFDYFRYCFTDEPGVPDGALAYFLDGTYQYQGYVGVSQLKDDAPDGGMIRGTFENVSQIIEHTNDVNVLDLVADLSNKTAGALLKWWGINEQETLTNLGAHWLTIAQVVTDDNGEYQGIWLADSDNDVACYYPEYQNVADDERAMAAAQMPNSYTYYDLSYEQLGEAYYWVVNDFIDRSDLKTYIHVINYLLNNNEAGGGDPDDIYYGPEDTPAVEDTDEIDITPYVAEEMRQALLVDIKSMMIEKDLVVYSPTDNVYNKSTDNGYSLILRKLATNLTNVYINGIRLEAGGLDYTIKQEKNGLFTIVISKEYLNTLEAGTYTMTMEFAGSEPVTVTIIVK